MNARNLVESVNDELSNAARLLKAAEALVALELYPDALNRAYYCVFHLTRALLLMMGDEPSSHAGAKSLLGLRLVKPGLLPKRATDIFSNLEEGRTAADYQRFVVIGQEKASEGIVQAKEFSAMTQAFMSSQGFGAKPSE